MHLQFEALYFLKETECSSAETPIAESLLGADGRARGSAIQTVMNRDKKLSCNRSHLTRCSHYICLRI